MIKRLEDRNKKLLHILKNKGLENKLIFELENAIEQNLVKKFWVSSQG
jgi:hypothetical protein